MIKNHNKIPLSKQHSNQIFINTTISSTGLWKILNQQTKNIDRQAFTFNLREVRLLDWRQTRALPQRKSEEQGIHKIKYKKYITRNRFQIARLTTHSTRGNSRKVWK